MVILNELDKMANIKKAAKVNSLLPLIKLNYDLPLILQGIFLLLCFACYIVCRIFR